MNNNELAAFLRQQAELLYDMGSEAREKIEDAASALDSASGAVAAERERICKAIKEEDDYCCDNGDYMLDSDDCIAVAKGTWNRPEYGAEAASKAGSTSAAAIRARGPAVQPSAGQVNTELLEALRRIAAYPTNRASELSASGMRDIARSAIASAAAAQPVDPLRKHVTAIVELLEGYEWADLFITDDPLASRLESVISRMVGEASKVTQPQAPESQWQPIETAPDDQEVVVWPSRTDGFIKATRMHGGWFYYDYCDCELYECHPTHWMPLPPATEKERSNDH